MRLMKRNIIFLFLSLIITNIWANDFSKAQAFFKEKDYYNTVLICNQLILLDHLEGEVPLLRGKANFFLKEYSLAINDLKTSLGELTSNQEEALAFLGYSYFNVKNHDDALVAFERSLLIDPNNLKILWYRGQIFALRGQYESALDDYTKSYSLDSSNITTLFDRGHLYLVSGQQKKAIIDLTKYVTEVPNDYQGVFNLGVAYYELGETQKAIQYYNRSLAMKNDFYDGYFNRALAYEKLLDYDKAVLDYGEYLKYEPEDYEVYFARAFAYDMAGNKEAALKDYDQTIHLVPSFTAALFNRAILLESIGKNHAAVEDYKKIVKINSQDYEAHTKMGIIYLVKLNSASKACNHWEIASKAGYSDALKYKTLYCK